MANQIIVALPRVTDANGDSQSGALAYFYQTGTTTPVTVYTDEALSVAHAAPVVADAGGYFDQVFYGGATAVKAVVKTSAGVTLYTLDPAPMIIGASSAAENISFSPITGNAATEVQTAIANNTTALAAKVATSRTLTAGTGLTGGGDLSANRTFAIDEGDAAALTAGTDGKFPDCATIRAGIDAAVENLTLETMQSASGTEVDFTGIPAGTKEIVVMFNGTSLSGTDHFLVQIGDSGGFETTGYTSASEGGGATATSTAGFVIVGNSAAAGIYGQLTLNLMDAATFLWTSQHGVSRSGVSMNGGGAKALSAELTQLRVTKSSGDTFDAGSVNIAYR